MNIEWVNNQTEIHVDGIYAGYIDRLSEDGWYGRVYYTDEHDRRTMKSFGVVYGKENMIEEVTTFIEDNYDNVRETAAYIHELNKDK